jgi:hypothetical protein
MADTEMENDGRFRDPHAFYPKIFMTKDSGKREEFPSGMVRDTQDGKPRYDLIPTEGLRRLAKLYTRGAVKYGDNNWQKGQPLSRAYASLFRHLIQWREGDRTEDHMAAVAWNAMAIMFYEENKPELDDLFNTEQNDLFKEKID